MGTAQMPVQKGIELFGERAILAILQELGQIDDKGVVKPMKPNTLTAEEKWKALHAITMIKEKRCGRIKGG